MKILNSNTVGIGKPLFILHGFLGTGDNWKSLANQYAEAGYEVHLIDQRNHGRSFHSDTFTYEVMMEDVVNYAHHHQIKAFDLIGHSMGGKTAMFLASAYPELVQKMIVVDIAPRQYPQHHQDILKGLTSLDFEKINNRNDADEQLKNYVSNLGIRQFLLKNLYRIESNKFGLRINLPVLVQNIDAIGIALPNDSLYPGPVLFVSGERSRYIEESDRIDIQHYFPQSQIVVIKNSGHWIHAENPKDFYEETIRFLKS